MYIIKPLVRIFIIYSDDSTHLIAFNFPYILILYIIILYDFINLN